MDIKLIYNRHQSRELVNGLLILGRVLQYALALGSGVGKGFAPDEGTIQVVQAWIFPQRRGRFLIITTRGVGDIQDRKGLQAVIDSSGFLDQDRDLIQCPHVKGSGLNWYQHAIGYGQRRAETPRIPAAYVNEDVGIFGAKLARLCADGRSFLALRIT